MLSLSVVISWLVVYFLGTPSELYRDAWLDKWVAWVKDDLSNLLGEVASLGVTLLMPVIGFSLLLILVGNWLFGLVGLLLGVFALLYSCGRYDYEGQLERYKNALQNEDEAQLQQIATAFNINTDSATKRHLLTRQRFCYQAYERWFAVAVWFLLLGVAGALFYRLCQLCAAREIKADDKNTEAADSEAADFEVDDTVNIEHYIIETAQAIVGWLDWIPMRLWMLVHALVGNFAAVIGVIKNHAFTAQSHLVLLDYIHNASIGIQNAAGQSFEELPQQNFDNLQAYKEIDDIEELNNHAMLAGGILLLLLIIIF